MKYRKKPVVIEAIKFIGNDYGTLVALGSLGLKPVIEDNRLVIETLEGVMSANVGDYIIKGVNGEFYPCKPDIFEKTYEIVTEFNPEEYGLKPEFIDRLY